MLREKEVSDIGWTSAGDFQSLRRVDRTGKLQATSRSAAPTGRYMAGTAAFEPLQRRPWWYPRPTIVESFHYTTSSTVRLMSLF